MVIRLEDATKRRNRGQRKLFSSLQRVPLVILLAGLLYFQFEGNDLSSNFLGTRYGRDAISVQYYSEAASGTKSVDCSVQRGNSGKWVHNWEVANRTHYKLPGTYSNWHFAEHQFQPTTDNPFRLATAWQWEDDLCPVSLINNEKFCDLMHDLDLRRFLIMGDSLSVQFAISFLALVGRVPSQSEGSFRGLLKAPFQVKCAARMPSANSTSRTAFNVEIYIIRRSPIADLVGLCLGAKSAVTPGEVPWDAKVRDFLFKDDSRAAIVFNTGIWLQAGIDEFKTGFHCLWTGLILCFMTLNDPLTTQTKEYWHFLDQLCKTTSIVNRFHKTHPVQHRNSTGQVTLYDKSHTCPIKTISMLMSVFWLGR